jgi:hypothetical protein
MEEMGGPFVQLAAFCQTTISDTSGSLSVIKIIDRMGIPLPPGATAPTSPVQITLAIILKSGFFKGKGTITIRPTIEEKSLPEAQLPALFEGDDRGVAIVIPMAIMLVDEGLYWFEVRLDGTILTKIPLRLIHQPAVPLQMGSQPEQ